MVFYASDFIDILVLLVGVVGGLVAYSQWRKEISIRRFETVYNLIAKINSDKTLSSTFDLIDWDRNFTYDGEFIITPNENGMSNEVFSKRIDELLSIFSYVCYLKKTRALTKNDMLIFNYQITRVLQNQKIMNYLYSFHHWSKSLKTNSTFVSLIEYAIE
jgi:hypothetical protein